ncbi:formyltetrahydrofolate deformylase [bacterium]|nr:MAG: formyltetrahydrofolate deformylase [bacterium]
MQFQRLLVSCPDRPGIVAAVSGFLAEQGANIVHADQHTTHSDRRFFLRVEFEGRLELAEGFEPIARAFLMDARFVDPSRGKRIAIFVSKEDHCLLELLLHQRAGDLEAEIALVVGNHPDLGPVVEPYGVPFHHVPMHDKEEGERRQLELIEGLDLIVLAKYMQIVTPRLLEPWSGRIINIHHSFLPAFVGARPYHQAHQRGVKLIGATAHYVTQELDAGPIIEQDVRRVDHRADPTELRRLGRQVERAVLARAVEWHCEDRVMVHDGRTVVFS